MIPDIDHKEGEVLAAQDHLGIAPYLPKNTMDVLLSNPYGLNSTKRMLIMTGKWLWIFENGEFKSAMIYEDEALKFLKLPIDQMPLYINDSNLCKQILSWYRLRIQQ